MTAVSADPRSWLDRALGLCFAILTGAVAIVIAVHLIESVWSWLLLIVSVGLVVWLAVLLVRGGFRQY